MAGDTLQQGSNDSSGTTGLFPMVVLFAAFAGLLLVTLAAPRATVKPRVFFRQPADGAVVPTTFTVQMGEEGLMLEPAGNVHSGAGHFHILIDQDFIPAGQVIPIGVPEQGYLHFGKAQTETQLTLTPGVHILRLQFADGAHIALSGDQYRTQITVTVK